MKLYFNGCSFTAGDELENPQVQAYPALIAQQRGCEFFNDAVNGGSNERTWMRTIQHLNQFDCFYIQWTFINRFTLYDPKNQWEVCFTESLTNRNYKNKDYYKVFGMYYYTHWDNVYQNYLKWLNQIISLQSLLEKHKKRYIMFYNAKKICLPFLASLENIPKEQFIQQIQTSIPIEHLDDTYLMNMHQSISDLLQHIDKSKWIDQAQWNPNEFESDKDSCQTWRTEYRHGNESWHRFIADYVMLAEQKIYESN